MWKYTTLKQCNEFLLSLNLIEQPLSNNEKIRKLYTLSNHIESQYKILKIRKKNGSYRTIYQPSYTLKHIQRKLLQQLLETRSISKYATAYQKGKPLTKNALPHVGKAMILKLDIKHFFESITFYQVYQAAFPIEYFPKPLGMLFTYLCTYLNYLPQGAPTSAYISNLVMKEFDESLGNWCNQRQITYTRYSDDMTFSGDFSPSIVIQKVKELLLPLHFRLNYSKICVIKQNQQQCVTGIVVNEKIQVSNAYRKKIRQEMYYIKKYGLDSHLKKINSTNSKEEYLSTLFGKIMYVLQINPKDQEFKKYKKQITTIINNITCK